MANQIKIEETALLVIDVTNFCCHQKNEVKEWDMTFDKIRKMVPKLKKFIKKYRDIGGQVIFVNCVPWRKEHLAKNIVELYKNPRCKHYCSDKSGFSEGFFEVKPQKEDFIVTKNTYGAFSNPKLNSYLKKKGVKQAIITGVFGDGCVESTIREGFSKGHNFIIMKDLIETTDAPVRQQIQKLLKEYTWPVMFGRTINTKEFFKIIS